MIRNHVTAVAAIFVCNLLLGCAEQHFPNPALLKLIAARHRSGGGLHSSSSYLRDLDSQRPADDDDSQLWLGSQEVSGSGGSKRNSDADDESEAVAKRFHPSAFFGSRGKRLYADDGEEGSLYMPVYSAFSKRFQQGFVGSRGRRGMGGMHPTRPFAAGHLRGGKRGWRLAEEDEEGQRGEEEEEGQSVAKRFDPSGFSGSRGKRYLPGLEALLLSQMYKKLDAEKWKRQSMRVFHAARG